MHYVSTVLGIRDPIHKQKIALKAMDVVLFGPPRGKWNTCGQLLIIFFYNFFFRRDWNALERLFPGDATVERNYRLLVRVSAK